MNTAKSLRGNTSSNKSKFLKTTASNFLEALQDQLKAASLGSAKSALDQLFGSAPVPQENQLPNFNLENFIQLREQQVRQQERALHERKRSAEVLVFCRKEELCKKQIEMIKQEIKILAKQTGALSVELIEAEKTVSSQTPDVKSGIYYFSFFERIHRLIKLAKKRINESRTWLQEFTARSKAKSYYWTQFSKSGTKFSLSQERYLATTAG